MRLSVSLEGIVVISGALQLRSVIIKALFGQDYFFRNYVELQLISEVII